MPTSLGCLRELHELTYKKYSLFFKIVCFFNFQIVMVSLYINWINFFLNNFSEIYLEYKKLHTFEVYVLISFNMCRYCETLTKVKISIFINPQNFHIPFTVHRPSAPISRQPLICFLLSKITFHFLESCRNGIIQNDLFLA